MGVSKVLASKVRVELEDGPAAGTIQDFQKANVEPIIEPETVAASSAARAAAVFGSVHF